MISLTAQSLVIAGAGILVAALIPVRRLIMRLPPSPVRRSWYAMAALIVVFFVGYLSYAAVFWSRHTVALDLIVPVVFFLGACFVLLTGTLSLRTTIDVLRISVLERQASTDSLTGVLNRRALDRHLSDEVARARRYSLLFSLLLFDVDHFKRINDNFGHPAGDRVLVGLAQIVTATLRETDILARYGGEEFMIVAPHTTRSGVADLAERVRKRIESHDFGLRKEADGSARVAVTASVGVATLGEQIDNVEKLVTVADKNLYRAKQEGRNRVAAEPLS